MPPRVSRKVWPEYYARRRHVIPRNPSDQLRATTGMGEERNSPPHPNKPMSPPTHPLRASPRKKDRTGHVKRTVVLERAERGTDDGGEFINDLFLLRRVGEHRVERLDDVLADRALGRVWRSGFGQGLPGGDKPGNR